MTIGKKGQMKTKNIEAITNILLKRAEYDFIYFMRKMGEEYNIDTLIDTFLLRRNYYYRWLTNEAIKIHLKKIFSQERTGQVKNTL